MFNILKILIILFILSSTSTAYIISGTKNSSVHKIASKILKKAYKKAGLDISFIYIESQKSLELSNKGTTDGEIARIKKISKLYPNLLIVPIPLLKINAMAFSNKKDININKWDDLKNYKFSIIKGIKFIEKSTKDMNRDVVSSYTEAFKSLNNKEVDIIVIPMLAGLKTIYKNRNKNIKVVSNSLQSLKIYHFVNEKNADLIPVLTPILKSMQDSGEINYWYKSYINSIRP